MLPKAETSRKRPSVWHSRDHFIIPVELARTCAQELEIDSTLNAIRHGCFGTAFAIQMRAKSTGDAFYIQESRQLSGAWGAKANSLFFISLGTASLIPQIYKFDRLTLLLGSACERRVLHAAKTGTKNQRTHQLNNLQSWIKIYYAPRRRGGIKKRTSSSLCS